MPEKLCRKRDRTVLDVQQARRSMRMFLRALCCVRFCGIALKLSTIRACCQTVCCCASVKPYRTAVFQHFPHQHAAKSTFRPLFCFVESAGPVKNERELYMPTIKFHTAGDYLLRMFCIFQEKQDIVSIITALLIVMDGFIQYGATCSWTLPTNGLWLTGRSRYY